MASLQGHGADREEKENRETNARSPTVTSVTPVQLIPEKQGGHGGDSDSLLSSSLEAEQRLLREMGWTEEEADADICAPLTDDEVREFQDLIVARKLAGFGAARVTASTDLLSAAATAAKAAAAAAGKNLRNAGSTCSTASTCSTSSTASIGAGSFAFRSRPLVVGRKNVNSSLASPQEFDGRSPSSSEEDSSSDDDDSEDEVVRAAVARFPGTCF